MIATPGGDEGGKMMVIGVKGDTVVSDPGVEDGLLGAMGDRPCLMEGDWVWWVSLVAWRLSAWKSTVLRGFPFFFGQTTILWHHVTGSPIGTGSITPRRTSWSSPDLISSCQWSGTGRGLWWATGVASGSTINCMGGLSIMGRGWCWHMLKVLDW